MVVSSRAACVPVTLLAPVHGSLAGHRRLRLGDPESHGCTVAAISGQGVQLLSARDHRGDSVHALARHQGRKAISAGRHILGGNLGCTSWTVANTEAIWFPGRD